MKVVGLGQCSLDYLFIVDSYPRPDTKTEILHWTVCGGGPVATALVSLSRIGIDCDMHGVIGDDENGHKIAESIREERVNIDGLLKRPEATSQTAFIAVEKATGKRTVFWSRASGPPLKSEEIHEGFLNHADFLLLDGLMEEASLYAAEKAKKSGIPVMLDAGRLRSGMLDLAARCDYVVASEEFCREIAGVGDEDALEPEAALYRLHDSGAGVSTVTLGSGGSVTFSDNEVFSVPAFQVDVVDTTGAGDVFHGGYIYGLLKNWNIHEVVRFATAFASLKCRKLGGRAGIPTLQEVNDLLKSVKR